MTQSQTWTHVSTHTHTHSCSFIYPHRASYKGHLPCVGLLVENNATLNAVDREKTTALMLAASNNQGQVLLPACMGVCLCMCLHVNATCWSMSLASVSRDSDIYGCAAVLSDRYIQYVSTYVPISSSTCLRIFSA